MVERCGTYLFLLLVEIIDDDADEQVECEERAKDDENDKVDVHVEVDLIRRLLLHLEDTVKSKFAVVFRRHGPGPDQINEELPLLSQLQHT